MTESDSGTSGPPAGRVSVLVVEPESEDLLHAVSVLSAAGFEVTTARTYARAKAILDIQPPSALLTTIRLGSYNGLHLVLRAKSATPHIAALVTSPTEDPVLQADAEKLGAVFMVKPVSDRDLVAGLRRVLYAQALGVAPLRPPFERRERERRTAAEGAVVERRVRERRRMWP